MTIHMFRPRAVVSTVALAAALACVPAAALAQSDAEKIDAVRRDSRTHVGPFYVTPTLLLKELGVDSNVFNTSGEQVSDFTFTLAPAVDVFVPVARRALLHATAGTDLVWYAKYDSERSVDPRFGGRGEVYLRRITLFAGGEHVNSRQRMNYEIDVRSRHLRNEAVAGVNLRLTSKFSVEGAARRAATEFDADAVFDGHLLQRTLNQETTGYSVTARHRLTPLTTLAVRYQAMRDEFEFSPLRNSESYRVMPGVEFKPRALIKGTAYVGYRKFTPAEEGYLPQFSGLVAQLGLSYTLLGSTTFGVSYGRDLTYSYEERYPFFVNESVGASVRRALGPRFDLLVSADRHHYGYENVLGDAAPALPQGTRTDVTWNYAGSVGYRLGRDGRVGVGASYWKRESTTERFRDYDNLRFGTTLTYGF